MKVEDIEMGYYWGKHKDEREITIFVYEDYMTYPWLCFGDGKRYPREDIKPIKEIKAPKRKNTAIVLNYKRRQNGKGKTNNSQRA